MAKIDTYGEITEVLRQYAPQYVPFMEHEMELLIKKNSSKNNLKVQAENEKILAILIEELGKVTQPITITDLMNKSEVIKSYTLENGNPLTNQKITYLFNHTDKITRIVDKKKAYYSINNNWE